MSLESNGPSKPATTVEHSSGGDDRLLPLRLSERRFRTVVDHMSLSLPNEGCGLMAGLRVANAVEAIHFFPGTNIDQSPVRFTMDPKEVIDAMWWMRTLGWHLAAIVHSHPRSAPAPSRTDLREWYYPEARLFIVSFQQPEPEVGCWTLAGDRETREFRRAPLLIENR